jgi:hypothetical protein
MRELLAGRRLEAASIGEGGITINGGALRVVDGTGALVAQVGALGDGSFGVAAINPATSDLVSLTTLAFGMRDQTAGGAISVTSTTYVSDASGPQVEVTVGPSRRVLVLVCAEVRIISTGGFPSAEGKMSVNISGPDLNLTLGDGAGPSHSGAATTGTTSTVFAVIGPSVIPAAGTYTIAARYRVNGGEASIQNRKIVALPY